MIYLYLNLLEAKILSSKRFKKIFIGKPCVYQVTFCVYLCFIGCCKCYEDIKRVGTGPCLVIT